MGLDDARRVVGAEAPQPSQRSTEGLHSRDALPVGRSFRATSAIPLAPGQLHLSFAQLRHDLLRAVSLPCLLILTLDPKNPIGPV